VLIDGLPDVGASTHDVTLLDEDLDVIENCSVADAAVEPPIAPEDSPDPVIFTWWATKVPDVCDRALGTEVRMGLGAYDARLTPYLLGISGIADGAESSLNAAYVSQDGKQIWVFGVVGPPEAFQGAASPAEDASFMDGGWKIVPVFDLPMP
jgi:hypothetical protein